MPLLKSVEASPLTSGRVDTDLGDRGEVVEGAAQAAYVADRPADDGQQAPHVTAETLHRALDVVHVVAGTGRALRGGVDVALLEGHPGRLEIGPGGLCSSRCT